MKNLYSRTYNFWLISRILFTVFGLIDLSRLLLTYGISILYILNFIYLVALIIIFFREITQSKQIMILKYIVGTITLLIGVYIGYLKFSEPKSNWGLARIQYDYWQIPIYGFSIWLILLGLFDFFQFNRDSNN